MNNIIKQSISEENKKNILNYKKYLKQNPEDSNARLNLAYLYINSNLINEAIKEYKKILKRKADIKAMFNLAICYANIKKYDSSIDFLKLIIKKDNRHFKAYRTIGDLYVKIKKFNEAKKFLILAKKIVSDDSILFNLLGIIEMEKNSYVAAEKYFLESLKLEKFNKSSSNNLAALYQKTGKNELALKIFNDLLKKFPEDPNLLSNLGNLYIDLNQHEKASIFLNKAISINPSESKFYSNLGRSFFLNEKYIESEKMIKKSIRLDKNNYSAHLIFFYLLIIKNNLKHAWQYFEARLNVKKYYIPKNLNKINNVRNKNIIILREAGLGDEVLFSSIYKDLIKENNKVVIECDPRLKNIFKRSFDHNHFIAKSALLKRSSIINKFDFSMYSGSLAGIYRNKLSDFKNKHYFKPDIKKTQYFKKKLGLIDELPKIGISWISKRLDLGNDKSINLEELLPILKIKKFTFINLQYGDHSQDIHKFNKRHKLKIVDFHKLNKFNDIEGLISLISNLDLVITVSNTTAHLAGALGKKTFLLAPDNRAQLFYWMLSKGKTPWYDSIQIFKKNKNWDKALKKIKNLLQEI